MDKSVKNKIRKMERKEVGRKFLVIILCVFMIAVMILPYLTFFFN